jgi:CheY-like chemotaxis protein
MGLREGKWSDMMGQPVLVPRASVGPKHAKGSSLSGKAIKAVAHTRANLSTRLLEKRVENEQSVPVGGDMAAEQKQGHLSSKEKPAARKKTVLLVDDKEMLLDVGRQMLEAVGYDVICARKGEDAIKMYQAHGKKIRAVILDMVLSDMEGGEAFEKMKGINPHVKVLLSSAYGIDREANAVLAKGCQGFLQKPFSLEQLSRELRTILDRGDTVSHE